MKKLSTLFPMGKDSSGNENYNLPSKIEKSFIVLNLMVLLTSGVLFGQNRETTPLKSEVKSVPANVTKQSKEKQANLLKHNEFNSNDNLKKNQSLPNPGKQPSKDNSLKNSENAHLGIHALIEGQSQVTASDKNADQKFINSERPSEKVKTDQNQVSNQTPYDALKNKKEDVSKRDFYSKTYDNGDGSYTALIGAGPIHYEKNGQFLDIDHKITQNFDQTYPFVNATNLFHSYFGSTSHTGLKNKTDDGELREFLNTKMYWEVNGQPHGLINSANTQIQIEGDKAYYRNLYGNIDVEFTMLTGKRELNYIIPNKQALGDIPAAAQYLVFSEDVILPFGWTHEVTDKGIVIKNPMGQSVYLYSNPVSTEANEPIAISKERNTIYETRLIGNVLTVLTKLKTSWLLSNERVFPVRVDPTANYYPQNAMRWTGFAENYAPGYGGNGNMAVGRDTGDRMSGFSKYDLTTLPNGSTINSVYSWQYYINRQGDVTNRQFTLADITVDPVVAGWYQIYNSTTQLVTDYAWAVANSPFGWVNMELNANGRTHIQNSINQNWVAICLYVNGATGNYGTTNYHIFGGYSSAVPPYLVIDYSMPANCSGTPSGGSVEVYAHVNDPGTSYGVYAFDYPQNPGIQYRWENRTSTNNGQTWTGWTNTTNFNSTYSAYNATAPAAGTRVEWRLAVRCTYSNLTGYTATDTFISSECYQGDGSVLTITDGWQITTFNTQRIANQVIVPQNSAFTIRTITMDVFAPNPVVSATFKFRNSDIDGLPNAVIEQFNLTSTRSIVRGTAFGFPWYRVSFDLTTPITLSQGNYWFEPLVVTNPANGAFWAVVNTGVYETALSTNGGTTWDVNTSTGHNVFFLVGDCLSCPAVTATADKYSVCEGDEVTLSANTGVGGYTYHWYIGYNSYDGTYDEDLGTGQTKTVTVDESTSYWVVAKSSSGCEDYTYVTIMLTPPPTLIVMDPIESITCSNESSEINLITGGIIPETILDEKWNPVQNPWIVSTRTWGGNGPYYARWALYGSSPSFHSPDNSDFIMVDSNAYGSYEMESSLIAPPMSLTDYNSATTNITLTFNHYFRRRSGNEEAKIEVTTDGQNWTTIQSYTATQGGATNFAHATINLNAYRGAPYFQLRFRYHANRDYYWAIDDVNITGTNPLPTTVTWSPITGLWFDEDRTLPYDGTHALTLYASPATTTTYTISAKTSVGCPSQTTVTVNRGDKNWISPSSTDWNIAANWNEGSVPTADHCVRIPSTSHKPIIDGTTTAFAKNVIIENGGGLTIEGGGSLTVTDYFNHLGTGNEADVVIKHNGNLIQVNDVANTGEITVEKDFKFSADRKQYNYVTAPVVSGRNMKTSIYTPNPTSVQVYNTGNDYFYETPGPYVSGLAYAVKESPGNGGGVETVAGKLMGVPFNGPLNYSLNTSGNRYNLLGNPYPSNLDIKELYDNNTTKIESTFYFWDNTSNTLHEQQGSNYNGDHYAKFNAVGNTGTAADCSVYGTGCNKVPDQYVKVGTGFMIQAKTGTLNFTNAYRTTAGNIDFFGKPSGFDTQYDRYWLTMTSPSGTQTMMAVVYFDGGTDEFSADDTKSFQGSNSLFSILDTKQLNIQGRAPFRINDRVPLGYKAFETGTYIIQLEDSDGIFEEGQSIYLIDRLLNKTVKITDKPYKFMTRAGEFNDRFVIVYRPGNVIGTASDISNQILFAKVNNQIVITSTIDKITEIELFNLNSRSVYKKSDINSNEHRIDALNFNHQIVVVTVKTETGEFVTRKFVNN